MAANRIIRLPEVRTLTGLSRSAIYDAIRAGKFPRQVPINPRTVGWISGEVDAWIQARISEARGEPVKHAGA